MLASSVIIHQMATWP